MKTILAIILLALAATAQAVELPFTFKHDGGNEKGFVVERSIDQVNYVQILTLEANVLEFVDPDVPLGQTVTWRVYAWNDYGDSGYSNVVKQITLPPSEVYELSVKKGNPVAKWFKKTFKGKGKKS